MKNKIILLLFIIITNTIRSRQPSSFPVDPYFSALDEAAGIDTIIESAKTLF